MRTFMTALTTVVLVLFVGATGLLAQKEGKKSQQERILDLSQAPPNETEEDKQIRLRALQIELKDMEKRNLDEIKKSDTPAMRKARKQLDKEADRVKAEDRKELKGKAQAAISVCDVSTVDVEPRATGDWSTQSYLKVRATNLHSGEIWIEDENGKIVDHLCSGGGISLFRSLKPYKDGANLPVRYIAKGYFPDGTLGIAESQQFRLSAYDVSSGRNQQFPTWNIRLQKVQPAR